MESAVLFLVFNRPDPTARVFEAIRRARPSRLYIAGDGPRLGWPDDPARVEEVRRIATAVNWPCDVKTRLQTGNLGGRLGPIAGIDWFFKHEHEGIILEDDCLPDPSFFPFCAELLARYRHHQTVMMVSGNRYCGTDRRMRRSYGFSRNTNTNGWATWRRAWELYDRDLTGWPALRNSSWLLAVGDGHRDFRNHWEAMFDQLIASQAPSIWDYQWMFSCWASRGVTVVPSCNLVTNIGFGADATHTVVNAPPLDVCAEAIAFPLLHPRAMQRDVQFDRWEDLHVHHVRDRVLRKRLRRIAGLRWARGFARRSAAA